MGDLEFLIYRRKVMKTKRFTASLKSLMIRLLSIFAITFSLLATSAEHDVRASGDILYVASGGMNSGSCDSWANACDLQYSMSIVTATDEIWVQQGTYKPTSGTDRTISFVLKDGVSLYGGFVGTEVLRNQRTSSASLTILSGDIGVLGDVTDNSYHVMVASGVTETTVLDGFTITGGYASGLAPNSFGAGIYNDGGSPKLNNVVFEENTVSLSETNSESGAGGGLYSVNGNPTFTNVTFNKNSVIHISTSYIGQCLGGGLYTKNGNLRMSNVIFTGNQVSTPMMGQCGGAGMYSENSTLDLTNMTFYNNVGHHMGWPNASLGSAGGGIWSVDSTVTIDHALFDSNVAHFGGGIMNTTSILTLTDVVFLNNTAYYYGGGVRNSGSIGDDVIIKDSTFNGNSAGLAGGGVVNVFNGANTIALANVTFNGNHADLGGGFGNLASADTVITLINITFKDNSADYIGGGAYIRNGSSTLNHVTFHGNTDTSGGGALYNDGASPVISNSIFWGDSSEIINKSDNGYGISTPTIKDSVISTGCPAGSTCTNIIITDPKLGPLVDNGGLTPTMALGAGSSAIDFGGQNSTCAASDQRGVMRPQGAGCDIGAYEAVTSTSMLVNSVLPTSRSVMTGSMATIFHTVINPNASAVPNVTLVMANAPVGTFAYQQTNCTTNAVMGPVNPSLNIPAGGMVCYILMFTPSTTFDATNAYIRIESDAVPVSNLYPGINTWLLRATASAGPDIIALTTTTDFHQVACSGLNAFAVALSNVGMAASGDITVSANTGSASLPISVSIQETNQGTGAIIGDNILNNLGAGENRTVAVFVTFNGCVNFDPAANRIFIEFRDASNNVVGSTSTAVSTNR